MERLDLIEEFLGPTLKEETAEIKDAPKTRLRCTSKRGRTL